MHNAAATALLLATISGMAAGPGLLAQTAGRRSHRAATKARTPAAKPEPPLPPLTAQERALQMLNRFTFGPRPGDLAAILQMGADAWFEQQLNPDSIPDPVLDKRLGDFPALRLSAPQLIAEFPTGQVLKQIEDGKRPMPGDPTQAAVYQVLLAKYEKQQQDQKAAAAAAAAPVPAKPEQIQGGAMTAAASTAGATANPATAGPSMTAGEMLAMQMEAQKAAQKKQDQAVAQLLADQLLDLPKGQRMAAVLRMPVDQRIVLTSNVADPQKSLLNADFNPREREVFAEMGGGPDAAYVVDNELQQAKVVRAILSERQLQEVMTDFWFNHFNVYSHKDSDQFYVAGYERDAIRAHALGKFRDLLLATAQHPAMLVYLDNWLSIGPDSPAAGKPKPGQKQAQRGLNENYGREVMELHTVGVDGGYSQADVTNLARILTGWTVDHPELGGGFVFDPRKHEPGPKKWFGQTVQENGYTEGQQALLWLASRPQTAHFISYKLAQRFVADQPPPAIVDRMGQTFLASDGDIKEVLRTMVNSPEFFVRRDYRNKVKTPLEFVASAFRATATAPSNAGALVSTLRNMGEPLYQQVPPTGYPMTADAWMNSGALVDRLNFSLALASNKLGNMKFDAPHLLAAALLARPAAEAHDPRPANVRPASMPIQPPGPSGPGGSSGKDEALGLMETTLTGGQVSARTNQVIGEQISGDAPDGSAVDPSQTLDTMTALILGSPEFQMR